MMKSKYKIMAEQIKAEYGLKLSAGTVQSLVKSGYDTARKIAIQFRKAGNTVNLITAKEYAESRGIKDAAFATRKIKQLGIKPVCKVHVFSDSGPVRACDAYNKDEIMRHEPTKKYNFPITRAELKRAIGMYESARDNMIFATIEKHTGKRFRKIDAVVLSDADIDNIKEGWKSEQIKPSGTLTVDEICGIYYFATAKKPGRQLRTNISNNLVKHKLKSQEWRDKGMGKGLLRVYKITDLEALVARGILKRISDIDKPEPPKKQPKPKKSKKLYGFWDSHEQREAAYMRLWKIKPNALSKRVLNEMERRCL